jgi:hypothetical protein
MIKFILFALTLLCVGCAGYKDTYTPAGIPNFHVFAPGMYRTGIPPTPAAWAELKSLIEEPGRKVTKVVLHDAAEGDESPAYAFGWNVVLVPLPPEDDKPLTIFVKPDKHDVNRAVDAILEAHARGDVVVWGCVHDRDRGGTISGLVGMRLFGWSKQKAWQYAIDTGLRWELPDLDMYWADDLSLGQRSNFYGQ